jgi:hypothetical protein
MATDKHRADEEWRTILAKPLNVSRFLPLSTIVELELGARSDCGRVLAHNTDHYLAVRLGRVQQILATSLAPDDLPDDLRSTGTPCWWRTASVRKVPASVQAVWP